LPFKEFDGEHLRTVSRLFGSLKMTDQVTSKAAVMSLRPEARPFTYELLTDSQKDAFQKITGLLEDALRQLDLGIEESKYWSDFPPRLQPQTRRINPAIMVTGGRGTGKTSLLLTLQREALRASPRDLIVDVNRLARLKPRLVWLETLDLEPFPKRTGLMGAIMARIRQAVDEDANVGNPYERSPQVRFSRVLRDLHELSLDACLAWDREDSGFQNSTDLSLHARDMMAIESARAGFQARFKTLLDDLAEATPWKNERVKPLFILPVDDIDLNPYRCLELLRLIRSFRSQRLVLVLCGDIDVTQSIVNLSYLHELGSLLPDHNIGHNKVRTSIDKQAYRLGAEAFRKMLPPQQRLRIGNVSMPESLAYCPIGSDGQKFQDLLKKIRVPFETPLGKQATLFELVDGLGLWPTDFKPSAAFVFTTTLRKLTDLWIRLTEITHETQPEASRLSSFIEILWLEFQRGLSESGAVNELDFDREVPYEANEPLTSTPFHLKFQFLGELEAQCAFPKASLLRMKFPRKLELSPPKPWKNVVNFSLSNIGRVTLLHDLMRLSKSTVANPLKVPQLSELDLARVDWKLDGGGSICSVIWPTRVLQTAWEIELFVHHWTQFRNRLPDIESVVLSRGDLVPATVFWLGLCGAFVFKSKLLWDLVKGLFSWSIFRRRISTWRPADNVVCRSDRYFLVALLFVTRFSFCLALGVALKF
jgi:hypothetical protein